MGPRWVRDLRVWTKTLQRSLPVFCKAVIDELKGGDKKKKVGMKAVRTRIREVMNEGAAVPKKKSTSSLPPYKGI